MIYEYIEWNTEDLLSDYIHQHKGLIDTKEVKTEYVFTTDCFSALFD
jgi:hypothetical protein